MATRNQATGLYEARRLFRSTGQEFVGVGSSKEEAAKDLKKQLKPLDIDYKPEVDAATLVKKGFADARASAATSKVKEMFKNERELIEKQVAEETAFFAQQLAEGIDTAEEHAENLKDLAECKAAAIIADDEYEAKHLARIEETKSKEHKDIDREAAADLRNIQKMVSIGKLPKRALPTEPTGGLFRSSGFTVTRDEEGRVKYEYAPDQQRNLTARPNLAEFLQKELADKTKKEVSANGN